MSESKHEDEHEDQADASPAKQAPPEGEATPEQPVVHHDGVPTTGGTDAPRTSEPS